MYSLKFYHRKFDPGFSDFFLEPNLENYIYGKLKEKQDLRLEQTGNPVLRTGLYGINNV